MTHIGIRRNKYYKHARKSSIQEPFSCDYEIVIAETANGVMSRFQYWNGYTKFPEHHKAVKL